MILKNSTTVKEIVDELKIRSRDALTKERQARMASGGGPESHQTNVDLDIANITPDLMKTAPCQFTSNMTESCLNSQYVL